MKLLVIGLIATYVLILMWEPLRRWLFSSLIAFPVIILIKKKEV